ncbi:hypothetical protein JMN32_26925 [Fulvivirga sp. 29W222]|uniref:Energy transducer TonB n=1 Tax=Fulvivirga marina TaxID=2494733 RepID=A0A937G454_9BACT|nr:hypothetical protein [Fulvivirga marina]MBL6449976.1 hypothetical protein [Fulvivirga marina]
MEEREEEKRNRKVGIMVSAGLHALLLIAFLFILAWREPDPPLPEYGIELNFGTSEVGTGEVQPETPAEITDSEEEAAPEEVPEEAEVEPVEESQHEQVSEPVEEVVETTSNTQQSPQVVPDEKEEVKKPEVKEEKKEEAKPVSKPVETEDPVKPENGANGSEGESNKPQNTSHGDDANSEGDKGDEQGTLDSRALYGNSGGGSGSSLEMTGWMWDFKPKPDDTSNENGRIVFEVKIDDMGEIISVRTIERSVSPAVEKIYRAEVEKLTFSKTSDNAIVAPMSTGKITFVIKSK